MKRVTHDELDYFLGRLNIKGSNLDAKAIDIMNRFGTLLKDNKEDTIYSVICINGTELTMVASFTNKNEAELRFKKECHDNFSDCETKHGVSPEEYQDTEHWWDDDCRVSIFIEESTLDG